MIPTRPAAHTDIKSTGWAARLPPRARAYVLLARLDRPVGTWLLFLPGLWGLLLPPGVSVWSRLHLAILFAIGSLAMRSAGCVINDLWDRDIDAKVARTAGRPLACGALRPRDALLFLVAWLLIAVLVLAQLRPAAWALAPLGLVLTALYPLTKRVTWWPQLVMGFTFGFGAPMGVVAATPGELSPMIEPLLALYAGVILWQLGFDTIYGFQDMEDDARIGVKSTSRLMAGRARMFIGGCYAAALVLLALSARAAGLGLWFWPPFALGCALLGWQVAILDPANGPRALRLFKANVPAGWILALAFACGRLL
jgi:4-hydroxybenzoate polyprenyltransferase